MSILYLIAVNNNHPIGLNNAKMIKNKIFKQGIGIAKKAKKQERIAGWYCKPQIPI